MKTKGKILVISGNPDLQDACRQALTPGDFSVQITDSLHDGIGTAREENVDVVFLDEEIFHSQREMLLLQKLWEKDADLVCLLLSNGVRSIGLFSHFRPKPATGFPFRWFPNTSSCRPPKPWNSEPIPLN